MVSNLLNFKDRIAGETLKVDMMKDRPMCMNQYKSQFGVARIADTPRDRVVVPWPITAQHIIVMIRNHMFALNVHVDGKRVTVSQIEKGLYQCAQLAQEREEGVGILTAEHRDTWAKLRNHLSLSPENAANLEKIDSALFVVCLDDYTMGLDKDVSHHQWFHNGDGHNRWFDKTIELIVANNGRAGINGEHAPADAVIPGAIFDYMIEKYVFVDEKD